jgi:hypothetical protein
MLDALETAPRLQVRNLSVLNYAAGMSHWSYKTDDTSADVLAAGYFESVRDMLAFGDWLFVSASDGPLILWVRGGQIGVTVERVR